MARCKGAYGISYRPLRPHMSIGIISVKLMRVPPVSTVASYHLPPVAADLRKALISGSARVFMTSSGKSRGSRWQWWQCPQISGRGRIVTKCCDLGGRDTSIVSYPLATQITQSLVPCVDREWANALAAGCPGDRRVHSVSLALAACISASSAIAASVTLDTGTPATSAMAFCVSTPR